MNFEVGPAKRQQVITSFDRPFVMSDSPRADESTVARLLRQYRRPIRVIAAILIVYALAGFFLAPWLVKKNVIDIVADTMGAELRLEKVAINPFVLSLRVDGLAMEDPEGSPFLRVRQVFVNFQLSSLFRWAWTFDEVRIDAPELYLARASDGTLNTGFFVPKGVEPSVTDPASNPPDDAPARLLIFDFAVNESVVNWYDEVPVEPVETRLGPVNIAVAQLNTLPDRAGQQDVVITTETSGTLTWSGSLNLNPLSSAGHASVKGSHFPLTSAYIKHEAGFDILDGTADVEFDYQFAVLDDGTVDASISEFNLSFDDVQVRTFNDAFGIEEPDRDVLQLSRMRLAGGMLRWPERTLSAQSFSVDDAFVSLYRNSSGRLNIAPEERSNVSATKNASGPTAEKQAVRESDSEWRISLAEFSINRMGLEFEDDSVDPAAKIGYRSLDLSIRDISNEAAAVFPTSLTLVARTEGVISVDGTIAVLPTPDLDLDVRVENLALAGAHPYLQTLADLSLDSGALNLSANLRSSAAEPLLLHGDVQIVDFLITETDEGSRLGSWNKLLANNLTMSAANKSLEISEIRLDQPYADILIAADGSANLGRVEKGVRRIDAAEGEDAFDDEPRQHEAAAPADEGESPLKVTVGRVMIENAAADFADLSLPLPFEAKIAELNGELSTIATASVEPSTVSLEGKVDEFGLVRVNGHATPFNPSENTDIKLVFENVKMPKFSAYMIPFAGREIASGNLDLELGYKVTASALEGENKIVLRDFELGDKVDHPGAMSLPLGLAVALLKDPDGKINIDVPVRGNVDDPEFKLGGVVVKAFINLITGIVTSPFRLLANLVGAESAELEYLQFLDGRSDLTPPELEKTAKIAEALALRPELMLQFGGVVDPEADGAALQKSAFDAEVEQRIASLMAAESDDTMYAEHRLEVIEQLYRESGITTDPGAALAELRVAHTTSAVDATSETEPQFDPLAYTESLRRTLIERQPLAEQDLSRLADTRANNVRAAIVATNAALETRIEVIDSSTFSRGDDEAIRMQMSLTTSAEGG
jgi:hypothetical protein